MKSVESLITAHLHQWSELHKAHSCMPTWIAWMWMLSYLSAKFCVVLSGTPTSGSTGRISSCSYTTIHPERSEGKFWLIQVDESILSWRMDDLTGWTQVIRLCGCVSDMVPAPSTTEAQVRHRVMSSPEVLWWQGLSVLGGELCWVAQTWSTATEPQEDKRNNRGLQEAQVPGPVIGGIDHEDVEVLRDRNLGMHLHYRLD